jgi:hypothetical protein
MADDFCEICNRSFGDPDYHGTGPSTEEWEKHYDHLLRVDVRLSALREKNGVPKDAN